MNRLILIGNGFDLAHGLKTRYTDFIDYFWEKQKQEYILKSRKHNLSKDYFFENENLSIKASKAINDFLKAPNDKSAYFQNWFKALKRYFVKSNEHLYDRFGIFCKNNFLYHISDKINLINWVDVEEEYYQELIRNMEDISYVKRLNKEFDFIKNAFEQYLIELCSNLENNFKYNNRIHKYMYSNPPYNIYSQDSTSKGAKEMMLLNFNYTPTLKSYHFIPSDVKINYIHGELQNQSNPIIFGYGDDNSENYKKLEDKRNNDYLENFKSFKYGKNNNYKNMLSFISVNDYEILIMGLSCGMSDHTLLKTLFMHPRCKLIRIFFHQIDDDTDNFFDTYINISRHFSDKEKFREIVASREDSLPLS